MPKHLPFFITLSIMLMFIKCSADVHVHVNVKPTDTESGSEEISESIDNRRIISNRSPGDKSNETKTEVRNIICTEEKFHVVFML